MKNTSTYQRLTATTSSPSCRLEQLPDELIIQILSQPVVDLATLGNLRHLSERMYNLCDYVIKHLLLPSTTLSVTIEQEGKNRISPHFKFIQFCKVTGYALFMSNQSLSRRYYSDRGNPVIRSLTLHSNDQHRHQQQFPSPLAIDNRKESDLKDLTGGNIFNVCGSSKLPACEEPVPCQLKDKSKRSAVKQPNNSHQQLQEKKKVNTAADHSCACHTKLFGNFKLKATQKEGFYTIEVAQDYNATSRYQQQQRDRYYSWKLAYQITNVRKPVEEYYVRLSSLSIDIEYLLGLENEAEGSKAAVILGTIGNMQLNKHLKKVVHWAQHRLTTT